MTLRSLSRTLCAALACLVLVATAHAERYAVLVGVSQLTYQPRSLWLDGPQHDVQALQATLPAQGIRADHTTVLADGVTGATPPTQAAILNALDALTPRLRSGDSVLLYWSGHGVRSPAPPKLRQEPDGQDEYLLARDAQLERRSGTPVLRGAVHDAALGARIDAWQTRGAQVFAVFDSCHAASSTRDMAPTGLRWRGLELRQLAPAPGRPNINIDPDGSMPAPQPRPTFVAFYASESHQRTPEWKGAGLFTQALLAAWTAGQPSYRSLAASTLQQYQQLAARLPIARSTWPSPLFEGDLDAPLWGHSPPRSADERLPGAAELSAPAPLPAGVRAGITLQRPGQATQRINAQGNNDLGRLPAGSLLTLVVENTSGTSLDMAVTYLPRQGASRVLYPAQAGDTNRLEAGTPAAPARWQQAFALTDDGAKGQESLQLTLAPALPQSLPRTFSAGEESGPAPWWARITWR